MSYILSENACGNYKIPSITVQNHSWVEIYTPSVEAVACLVQHLEAHQESDVVRATDRLRDVGFLKSLFSRKIADRLTRILRDKSAATNVCVACNVDPDEDISSMTFTELRIVELELCSYLGKILIIGDDGIDPTGQKALLKHIHSLSERRNVFIIAVRYKDSFDRLGSWTSEPLRIEVQRHTPDHA